MIYIIDIETDGLYRQCTKIHCLSYLNLDTGELKSLTNNQEISDFIDQKNITIVGHNIIRYDIPVLEKLLGIKYQGKVIDTLALSWYLFPDRKKHGLESYGEEFNLPKPVIHDWNNLQLSDYTHRCETDVRINEILWKAQKDYLSKLYEGEEYYRLIGYLNFKFECLLEQEMIGITLDLGLCEKTEKELNLLIDEKIRILVSVMPKDIGRILRKKPANMYKKDGSLSNIAVKWFELIEELNLPIDTEIIYEKPNPTSPLQLKKWLDTLGWKPATFKLSKNTGENVAQVSLPNGSGICKSVKELYTIEPNLKELEDLFMLQHRLGIIKSFLNNKDENNKIYATAHGFTNTLRLQHSVPVKFTAGLKQLKLLETLKNKDTTIILKRDYDSLKNLYIFVSNKYIKIKTISSQDPKSILDMGKVQRPGEIRTLK